jgi:hypothetical protein
VAIVAALSADQTQPRRRELLRQLAQPLRDWVDDEAGREPVPV